jgi:hypothetical protein
MPDDKSIPVMLRLPPIQADAIDDWRRKQKDIPSRPEAIRRWLVLADRFESSLQNFKLLLAAIQELEVTKQPASVIKELKQKGLEATAELSEIHTKLQDG